MGSNWGIAAGIGQGVMQGLQFNRQMEADRRADQALQNQNEVLQMQKQIHGEKMGALNRENEERQRVDTLGNLKTGIETSYQDVPDYKRQQMFVDYGLQTGLMKPADLDAAKKLRDNMIQMAGPEAYQAVLRGDIKPMQQLLGTKGYDIQADAKSGNYLLRMPGSDAVQSIDKAGLLQLNAMATYRDQLAAREKAALDARKSKAEAGLKEAQVGTEEARAGYYSRMPQDRFSLSARGAGKGKGEGEYDPISTLEDFNKAIGNDPATGQPYAWAPTAAQHYQQIIDANPDLSGKQGGQYALNMAIALGKGQARAIPEIDANGNAKLVATWPGSDGKSSPRKVVLQSDIDMSDPAMVQGVGGNQAAQQQEWVKAQASAVQQFARSSPTDYRNAAMASGSEEGMATLAELAKKNPEAARAYNFAKHIRDLTKLQATVTQDPSKPAPTKEQKAVADALKLDVNDPGMLDRIRAAGNRFVGAISGVAKRAQEENIESQLRIFREYPNDRSVREWLYAKSQGNPELQKRILEIASPK